jgi:GTPase KRas
MQREIDGNFYTLEILDTAGQDEYASLRDMYMRSGDTFILVYSITDRGSFEEIKEMHEKLLIAKEDADEVPCILVGAKCDLEKEREVSIQMGKTLAQEFGCCLFLETSAKKRINVEECFDSSVKLLLQVQNEKKKETDEENVKKEIEVAKKNTKKPKSGLFSSSHSLTTKEDVDDEIQAIK